MECSDEPIREELENGEFTFDRSDLNQRFHAIVSNNTVESEIYPSRARIVNQGNIMNTLQSPSSLGTGWCRKCSTSAKMNGSDPKHWERLIVATGSPILTPCPRSGVCDTNGCPGYVGHPPAGRPQGDDHDETSDDVPLLFSPLSSSSVSHSSQELELVDHCHCPEPKRAASATARRKLGFAILLCTVFVIGEVLGGYYSGSLAIMGDAAHMFSDLASFGVSFMVLWISDKQPKKKMTFGYHRAEALGALATLIIIWYVTGILVYLAVRRIHDEDFEIHDTAMLVVACAAVVFNVVLGLTLHGVCKLPHAHSHGGHGHAGHGHHEDEGDGDISQINIRAAMIHVLGDLLQSIGVLLSSLLIKFFGDSCKIADPICTLIFACIVFGTTLTVLKDTLRILLEGTPPGIDYDSVMHDLLNIKEVYKVHSLHLWSLTADLPVMSAHLATAPSADQEQIRADTNRMLRTKYKIFRTTLQVEHYNAQVMGNCEKCNPLV